MPVRSPRRSARPPGTDWQESYYSLDQRFRQVQKQLNEKEEELKFLKVSQRRKNVGVPPSTLPTARVASSLSADDGTSRIGFTTDTASARHTSPKECVSEPSSAPFVSTVHVSVPNNSRQDDAAASVLQEVAAWSPTMSLPDPAMVWGSEGSVRNYVAASALYHANEELRRKLNESSTVAQSLQHELATTRALSSKLQARVDDLAQQTHQMVRERDLAVQKLSASQKCVLDLERTLKSHIAEEDKERFNFESQVTELRSRLVAGADSNELLSRDIRTLIAEAKERTSEVMSLRSKMALTESALSSQRSINENLLIELKSLNSQLVDERKRLLASTREVQLASLSRQHVGDLEAQVRRLTEERTSIEREHTHLMGEFVRVTEVALRSAKEEVQSELDNWRGSTRHWEQVSQLLYRDIAERTQAHHRCRDECDTAKSQRDALSGELRHLREELQLCRAKLEVVWPNHDADAEGMNASEVLRSLKHRRSAYPVTAPTVLLPRTKDPGEEPPSVAAVHCDSILDDLPVDPTTAAERIHELSEANAGLEQEIVQLRLTNEMLQARIDTLTGRQRVEKQELVQAARDLEAREAAGTRLLEQQMDRVEFLESQVRSLRGYHVTANVPVDSIEPSETVLELFLGQLVAAHVPEGMVVPLAFSQVFGSVDFLLHETVTTPMITGLHGFLDTTVSFCICMDALLLYYLQTRELLVQLHRTRQEVEESVGLERASDCTGAECLFETLAEGRASLAGLVAEVSSLNSNRPMLRGHIQLWTPDGVHLASLEFQLTARTPFSEEFKALVRENPPPVPPNPVGAKKTEPSNAVAVAETAKVPSSSALQKWVHSSSSSSAGSPSPLHHTHRSRRRATRCSEMQLIQAQGTSSDDLTSNYAQTAPTHREDTVRLYLPSTSRGPLPVEGNSTVHHTPTASRIEGGGGQSPFVHVDRSLRAGGDSSTFTVHSVAVEVLRVELPADLPTPIPRLSCYYALPALGQEVHLAAPPMAQYTVEYAQGCEQWGQYFEVRSLTALAGLAREPLVLFLNDEDAGPRSGVWAMAVCEWSAALAHPEEPQALALPLHRRGTEKTPLAGAVLRLRLWASAQPVAAATVFHATPLQAGPLPGPLPGPHTQQVAATATASHLPQAHPHGPVTGPTSSESPPAATLAPEESLRRPSAAADPSSTVTPPREPPSALEILQQLMGNPTPLPVAVPSQQFPPRSSECAAMEEELMRLEINRLGRR